MQIQCKCFTFCSNSVSPFLRSFIWSMTSWRRGLMCQQRLTTTQPSRPSKARPVQRLQLFLHTAVVQEGRCGSHSLVFIPRGFGYLTVGAVATIQTALPFQTYMLPKTTTLVPFLFFKFLLLFFFSFFFFQSCFEQGLCYVYFSESEACFLPERRTDLVAQDSDRTRVRPGNYNKC